MDRRRDPSRKPLFLAFLAATFLQIPLVYWIDHQMASHEAQREKLKRPPMTAQFVERKRTRKKKAKPPEEKVTGTVVSLPPPEVETQAPEKAKFLAQHNARTERETRARKRTSRRSTRKSNQQVKK